jgi:hypothetical protein
VPLAGLTPLPTAAPAAATTAVDCPAGTVETTKTAGERAQERQHADAAFRELLSSLDSASADRATACRPIKQPEPFLELQARQAERNVISAGPLGYTPPGAVRAAVAAKAAATQAASTVPGAQGRFTPLGKTPLIADDPELGPNVAGLGLADQAGRIDSYAYDPVHKRLFSAPGTGGVWMSTDTGKSWRSVGDSLPYQSVGSVDWSPAGSAANGTLVVLSGEASAGGNVYTGMGAFYSTDLGATWLQAKGIPDGLMGFEIDIDPTNPQEVYAATSQGLYRSTDAGKTYVNVKLPTGDCAGVTGYDNICQNANWVTDVEIKAPGRRGRRQDRRAGAGAVGYAPASGSTRHRHAAVPAERPLPLRHRRAGQLRVPRRHLQRLRPLTDRLRAAAAGRPHRARLGHRSRSGPRLRYAIVEDAVLFNGGVPAIDAADPTVATGPIPNATSFNGIYVSSTSAARGPGWPTTSSCSCRSPSPR